MAVAYQSHSTQAFGSGTTLTITKPTGLAVGDLMVAHCAAFGNSEMVGNVFATPTGWSVPASASGLDGYHAAGNVGYHSKVFFKVAQASDVAAANFSFSYPTTGNLGGAIYRITGHHSTNPIQTSNAVGTSSESDSTSPFNANASITPVANCLLLFLTAGTAATSSFSSQAIATDNPTWTEDYDFGCVSGSHASRSQTTATGNASYAFTDGGTTVNGVIVLAIQPPVDVSVSAGVVSGTLSVQAPTIKTGVTVSVSASLSVTSSVQTPIVSEKTEWTAQDKNSAPTWTNQDKSTT